VKRELLRIGRRSRTVAASVLLVAAATGARAQSNLLFSVDVTASLGAGPTTVTHSQIAGNSGAGVISPALSAMTSLIPENAGISDFELSSSAPTLLALDIPASLPGLLTPAEPRDVVAFDATTSTFSYVFVGVSAGVPDGIKIDAVSRNPSGDLLLSFDTTLTLPGVGTINPEDLVRYAGGTFTMVFDGSANGVLAGLDLDAASRVSEASNVLLVSFDGSGVVGGVPFDDEDVLRFDPGLGAFSMYADKSVSDPVGWPPVNLVGLPEPGFVTSLALGVLLLGQLARRRAPHRVR
jgi:hypothetical protein